MWRWVWRIVRWILINLALTPVWDGVIQLFIK